MMSLLSPSRVTWFPVLLRLPAPGLVLLALLQRTPVLRLLLSGEAAWAGVGPGQVLRAGVAAALATGVVDTLAGATTFTASPTSPAAANVGTAFSAAFAVTGSQSATSSYTVKNLPPGLTVPSSTVSGTSLLLNAGTGTVTGTPTTAGTYAVTITAWEGANATKHSKAYTYSIVVAEAQTAPVITTAPTSRTAMLGAATTFTVAATGAAPRTHQWYFNDAAISGATGTSHTISATTAAHAGVYSVKVTNALGSVTSARAALALTVAERSAGDTTEVGPNIVHSNGNVYDQFLLTGATAFVKADSGQILRISYLDLTDDIVQVEFSGAGTLMLALDSPTGPATPVKYNQSVTYMRGHARLALAGADATTNLSVFSVGRMTAVNQALFNSATTYDGHADIASVTIVSADGAFAGLRTANATYFATSGVTGVCAPGVTFGGPVFVGDLSASDAAVPMILLGSAADVRITGGDLLQANAQAVTISGITQLKFVAGQDSHGNLTAAQTNQARLEQNGIDVTASVVTYP